MASMRANVNWSMEKKVKTCDACEINKASYYCEADEAYLCSGCDASVHCANTLASRHKRVSIYSKTGISIEEEDDEEEDGVCPEEGNNLLARSTFFDSSLYDDSHGGAHLGSVRIGDITYARISNLDMTSNPDGDFTALRSRAHDDEEEAHQVPRFVPVAQELPSLRLHLQPPGFHDSTGKFMSLFEDSPEQPTTVNSAAISDPIDLTSQETGVVPVLIESSPSTTTGIKADKEREARVNRYREKRRTRMFSKKIRYEVRKIYAENRPRLKGRFVRRTAVDVESGE